MERKKKQSITTAPQSNRKS